MDQVREVNRIMGETLFDRFEKQHPKIVNWIRNESTTRTRFEREVRAKVERRQTLTPNMIRMCREIMDRESRITDPAGHFGKIGEQAEVRVRIASRRGIRGNYGPQALLTMQTDGGHVLKTISASKWAFMVPIGETCVIKVIVRKHEDGGETYVTLGRSRK